MLENKSHWVIKRETDLERGAVKALFVIGIPAIFHACGELWEKFRRRCGRNSIPNFEQTTYNFGKAIDPIERIGDSIDGMSVEEAEKHLNPAAHIFCNRSVYSHHGLYDGNGYVYEYGGPNGDMNGVISHVSLRDFAKGDRICERAYQSCLTQEQIIARAKTRLGENNYSLWNNNCENFVVWCYADEQL